MPVPGYQLLRCDRADGRGYGGVALLVRDGLDVTVIEIPGRVIDGAKLESIWTRVGAGARRVAVCSLYRPPGQTVGRVTADLEELERQLQHVLTRHSGPIVLAGDANINLASDSTAARRMHELLATY